MREMVQKLLEPLSVSITLEKRLHSSWVKTKYGQHGKVQARYLGMGCESATWYGTIDARLRGQVLSEAQEDSEVVLLCDDTDTDGEETDGGTSVLELKRKGKGLSQAIGSAILASFIESNLHPNFNHLFPCIFMNCTMVQFIYYDCEKDVLLITEKIPLYRTGSQSVVSSEAKLIMWLHLNHR